MRKIIASAVILLALTGSAQSGLSKGPHAQRVLNSQTLSGLCVGLPQRDESAQRTAHIPGLQRRHVHDVRDVRHRGHAGEGT